LNTDAAINLGLTISATTPTCIGLGGGDTQCSLLGVGANDKDDIAIVCPFHADSSPSCMVHITRITTVMIRFQVESSIGLRQCNAVMLETRLFEMLNGQFDGELAGRCIAVWGLAFKPNTDDIREAPSRVLIDALLDAGASVRAHDPEAMEEAHLLYAENKGFSTHKYLYDAAEGADALVLVTEWKHYWIQDFERLAGSMRQKVLVDGRNIWPQSAALRHGFTYHAIGRPSVIAQ
jgi:UDPglucose 6-dehydrogenase